jgi:integrase
VRNRPDVLSALEESGLTPAQRTPHTLRRSVATAVTREVGLEHASELLGHSDTRITKRSYVAPTARSVAAQAIDELFG